MTGFAYAGKYGPEVVLTTAGTPCPSIPVTVYLTGTTTPASLYTDHTKATAQTNPVTTDGNGNLTFNAVPGIYDLSFTVGGVATTLTVEVLPYFSDIAAEPDLVTLTNNDPTMSDYTVLHGAVPSNPQWIIKSQSFVLTPTSGGIVTCTWTHAFPNAVTGLVICPGDTVANLVAGSIGAASVTLSSFQVEVEDDTVSGGTTSGNTVAGAGLNLLTSGTIRINSIAIGC
jgi:hypothetical protein